LEDEPVVLEATSDETKSQVVRESGFLIEVIPI
jgi:hypothetical protein